MNNCCAVSVLPLSCGRAGASALPPPAAARPPSGWNRQAAAGGWPPVAGASGRDHGVGSTDHFLR